MCPIALATIHNVVQRTQTTIAIWVVAVLIRLLGSAPSTRTRQRYLDRQALHPSLRCLRGDQKEVVRQGASNLSITRRRLRLAYHKSEWIDEPEYLGFTYSCKPLSTAQLVYVTFPVRWL